MYVCVGIASLSLRLWRLQSVTKIQLLAIHGLKINWGLSNSCKVYEKLDYCSKRLYIHVLFVYLNLGVSRNYNFRKISAHDNVQYPPQAKGSNC